MLLAYFTAGSCLFFDIVYNQLSIFSDVLLFTRLSEWAVGFCALTNKLLTISFTKSGNIGTVTESFKTLFKIDLAIFFASDVVFLG